MSTSLRVVFLSLLLSASLAAVPVIGPPVNQASFEPPTSLTYGIAQGSMFAVFGTEMGPAELVVASAFPLLPELAGTSAQVTMNGETFDCIMVFTSAGQIAAILPSATPLGDGELRVTYNGETSAPQPIRVVAHAVGMFTIPQNGQGPAVVTDANFSVNTYMNSFAPGTVGIAWVTGLGARTADDRAVPQDLKDLYNVEVGVGGISARVLYAGPSGCCAGVDQIVYEIPGGGAAGTAQAVDPADPLNKRTGCHVPLVIQTGEGLSNFTSISVSDDGPVCSDPHQFSKEEISVMHLQGGLGVLNGVSTGISLTLGPVLDVAPAMGLTAERPRAFGEDAAWVFSVREDYVTPRTFYMYGESALRTCRPVDQREPGSNAPGSRTGSFSAHKGEQQVGGGDFGGKSPSLSPLSARPDRLQMSGSGLAATYRWEFGANDDNHIETTNSEYKAAIAFDRPAINEWSLQGRYMATVPSGQTVGSRYVVISGYGQMIHPGVVTCINSAPGRFTQRYVNPFFHDLLHVQVEGVGSHNRPRELVESNGMPLAVGLGEQLFSSYTATVPPGELIQASGQSDVTPEGTFLSCNLNVNDVALSLACRFRDPGATSWGLAVEGLDQNLFSGSLPEGDTFSSSYGVGDLKYGDPTPGALKQLIEEEKVSIHLTDRPDSFVKFELNL